MKEAKCFYCGEEQQYTVLIPKPSFFITESRRHTMVDAGELTCLNCLREETENLKGCY